MNEFLQRLKQRKLVQWAIAYIAAAFALLQGIDIVAQQFGWPEGLRRGITLALVVGFFVALLLAWYHGERGAQRVSGPELLILALILAFGGGLLWRFAGTPRPAATSAAASSQAAVAIPAKSIAVLPFESLSAEKDNAYFADGIQDEILTGLAKIGDLKVISRTSTQSYGSKPQNLAEIGRQLGVAHVLEGSVQKAGNRVRVNVQLLDAANDDHLWAETYDRTLEDVFAVETEVAQKIALSLQAQLTRDERAALAKKPTDNPIAYESYLKARSLLLGSSYDRVNTEGVLDALQSAVKLDPGFAEAWAQLSITNSWIYWIGFDPTSSRLAAAKAALDRAATLAPDLPRVQKAHAMYLYFGKRDFAAALNIWRSLQHRLPNDDEVWYFSALLERRLGLFDAAVADFERARLLNPNGVVFATELGLTLFLLHRYQEAVPVLDAGLAWQPDDPSLLMLRLYCAWNLDGIAGGERMLASIKSDTPAIVGLRALQALFERDYNTAANLFRRALASKDDALMPISLNGYVPANVEWQLHLALSEQRNRSPATAAELYHQVQARAQAALSETQGNRNVEAAWHVALAWADAGLGQRDESIAEAQRATALIPESADTLEGPVWQEFLAKTYAMNGDADHALPLIEHLLQSEISSLSSAILQLDPAWDPIRDDPRFQALLKLPAGGNRAGAHGKQSAVTATTGTKTAAAMIPGKSIAVLPFTDLSPEHDQEPFSDGMAEEILNALARIKNLKVVGRASSFYYKGKDVSLKQIGTELGVANVLEGSVRKQGERVRITAALSRTSDGLQVWSKNYDGTLADIFDLQETFARDIASELKIVLADVSEARLVDKVTGNPQAYALFVEAQSLVNRRVGDSLPRAIQLLEEATRLDPEFARAWSKLGVALAVAPQYSEGNWEANWAAAEKAAQRAIALDAESAEAYATLGYIAFSRRRYLEMVEPAQRALVIDPNDVTSIHWAANELAAMGRSADAEALTDRGLALDPASGLLLFHKGFLRYFAGDKAAALKLAKRADALGFPSSGITISSLAAIDGDFDTGAKAFARGFGAFKSGFSQQELVTIYRASYGNDAARRAGLAVVAAHPHDQFAATMLLILGEPAQSFATFERDGIGLSDAYYDFLWQPDAWSRKARQHPAFQDFAKRMGLVDYWKQNRWPDLCQPSPKKGPDSFTCR